MIDPAKVIRDQAVAKWRGKGKIHLSLVRLIMRLYDSHRQSEAGKRSRIKARCPKTGRVVSRKDKA